MAPKTRHAFNHFLHCDAVALRLCRPVNVQPLVIDAPSFELRKRVFVGCTRALCQGALIVSAALTNNE